MVASVIIPNWNGKHLLKTCLSSLQKQSFKDLEVIVVDNGSSDGSIDYIKKYFPDVKLVQLDKNHGFAYAINRGIEKSKSKYIVLINNDTETDKNCIQNLINAANDKKDVGFIAAKMLQFHNRGTIDSAGDYIDNVGHANNIGLGQKDGPEFEIAGPVFLVTGGGGLFSREVFDKVGIFDEDYFAYFEDVDLCLRAQMQGFKGWYEPKAVIYHIHKATSSKNKAFLEYLQFRNMMQTIIKDFPAKLLKNNWLMIVLVNLNTVRYLATRGHIWQALKAEGWILLHLLKLLQKRHQIQVSKKVTDEYLISNFQKKKITLFGLLKWQ